MQKENSADAPSAPTARLRHRKRQSDVVPETGKPDGRDLLVDDDCNKYKSFLEHIPLWMIGGFALIVYMGHLYIQIFMAHELFNLLRRTHEDRQLPGFRLLNWHFFFTAMLFVYGRILSQRLVNTVTLDKVLCRLVSSPIKYHIGNLLLLVHLWFLLLPSLIVINDIFAYIFGFFFGRTPLTKLSPKKTWEGFIGASVTTMISAFLLANVMGRLQWLNCPREVVTSSWKFLFRLFFI